VQSVRLTFTQQEAVEVKNHRSDNIVPNLYR